MWVTPRPVRLPTMFWTPIEQKSTTSKTSSATPRASLILYRHKSLVRGRLGGFIDSLTAKVTQLDVTAESPLTYRIVLHLGERPEEENAYLLAVSDDRTAIWAHWEKIVGEGGLLSDVATKLGEREARQAPVSITRDGATTIKHGWTAAGGSGDALRSAERDFDLLAQPDVQEYVLGKVGALAQTEEGEPVKNVEAEIAHFHTTFAAMAAEPGFTQLSEERLITYYKCSLWRGFPRRGTLYVTEHFLCFDPQQVVIERATDGIVTAIGDVVTEAAAKAAGSALLEPAPPLSDRPLVRDQVAIRFRDVRSVTKERALGGLLHNSIKIGVAKSGSVGVRMERGGGTTTDSKDLTFYTFAFVNRQAALELIERVWGNTMDKLLAQHAQGARTAWIPRQLQAGNDSDSEEQPSQPAARSSPHMHKSKHLLDSNMAVELFQTNFHLYIEEPMNVYNGSVWFMNTYLFGKIYVTQNTICYQSNFTVTGKNIWIVCPLLCVSRIDKTSPLGFLRRGLSIIMIDGREIFFLLYSRDHCFELLFDRWDRSRNYLASSLAEVQGKAVDAVVLNDADLLKRQLPQTHSSSFLWAMDDDYMQSSAHSMLQLTESEWAAFEAKFGVVTPWSFRTPKLLGLVRLGIPDHRRRNVWQILSGSYFSSQALPSEYMELLSRHEGKHDSACVAAEEIEKDLRRALPSHPYFHSTRTTVPHPPSFVLEKNRTLKEGGTDDEFDAPGIDALRRVLAAFSWRNPHIGYCQSMNIIAATFLLYMPEEECFWLLCTVCENIVPQYYTRELLGSQVDQFVFNSLVEHNLPLVDAKLKELGLPLELLTLPWFMCLFVSYIPYAASLRVLDCFFAEGPDVLFKVGLALLKLCEPAILAEENPEAIVRLTRPSENDDGIAEIDVDRLLHTAFTEFGFLPTSRINELRNTKRVHQIQHIADTNRRRLIMSAESRCGGRMSESELDSLYRLFSAELEYDSSVFALDEEHVRSVFFRLFGASQDRWWDLEIVGPTASVSALHRLMRLYGIEASGGRASRLLDFLSLVEIVVVVLKGRIEERFRFCIRLVDFAGANLIDERQLVQVLRLLHRMTFDEPASIRTGSNDPADPDNASPERLAQLAVTAFAKAAAERKRAVSTEQKEMAQGTSEEASPVLRLSADELVDLLITKPLLPAFWFIPFEDDQN